MTTIRQDLIANYRRSQPIEVLRQRAKLARRKQKIWTQEQIDLAIVLGQLRWQRIMKVVGDKE